ncbi:capsule biosynthesis protein [Actibacterium lipolyticum]|uniref:Capsule biosynthesis protein n=1 Tax=Actibacterium lipolyticum TaxID=1524263 RepID=A0A238JLB8_9RHOB|nr:capsule biosynthesis protein [Actibacterium lipolyticum]SMX31441.1 hypothetical protein COL8621_00449 [Actibacterium lipolyticum]
MTTKPRAKKYRARRNPPPAGGTTAAANVAQQPVDDGFGDKKFPTAAQEPELKKLSETDRLPKTDEPRVDAEIADIRKEGLTGRQLRMARRVAQKHGLSPTSDFDAVRQLRKQGIDPFQKANLLELATTDQTTTEEAKPKLPQTVPQDRKDNLPSTEVGKPPSAADQVYRIQQDIARRRRRRFFLMLSRLFAFVFLPGLLAGYYYFAIATPMYATKSEFVIQQAESSLGGGLGSMFAGTGLAVQQDSITVQSYLESRDAMRRLDDDLGFRDHFSQDHIDPIQKLDADASREAAYKVYKKNVKIGYDPTEGIMKMEVVAADPETSAAFSKALISYAEERVDSLTQRLRGDQMEGAIGSYERAEERMTDAQNRVLELQEKLGVLDPVSETSALMGQITSFESQLREKRLQLDQLLDNARPNKARVDGVRGDVKRLENLVEELRASMTESTTGTESLARISAELRIAEAELANRQLLLQQALQQVETARIEANRQVRYLELGVIPIAPDEPTYPRAFENTLLAFLIFGGIYLMISLTASILREQVSG